MQTYSSPSKLVVYFLELLQGVEKVVVRVVTKAIACLVTARLTEFLITNSAAAVISTKLWVHKGTTLNRLSRDIKPEPN